MKLYIPLLSVCLVTVPFIEAQNITVQEIKESGSYFWAEGENNRLLNADSLAVLGLLDNMVSDLSVDFSYLSEFVSDKFETPQSALNAVMRSYYYEAESKSERIVINNEPRAKVLRYLKKTDIDKLYDVRKDKITENIALALKAENRGKVDDALKNYYWSLLLLESMPDAKSVTADNNILFVWLPERINYIFDHITVYKGKRESNNQEIYVEYNGKLANSFAFSSINNGTKSGLYYASGGLGVLECKKNEPVDRISCEYEFMDQMMSYKYIFQLSGVLREWSFSKSIKTILADDKSVLKSIKSQFEGYGETETSQSANKLVVTLSEKESAPYRQKMNKIIKAFNTGDYSSVKSDCFTPDGAAMLDSLVNYGRLELVEEPKLAFKSINGEVVCRGVILNFKMKNNSCHFVENVRFSFNPEGLINSLAFGLDGDALIDINNKTMWGEYARNTLIEFLENYKTAYSLKRLDYLEQVYADYAVIITGTELERSFNQDDAVRYLSNRYVVYNRQTKDQYMANLRRSFKSKEYINIHFEDNDIKKAAVGGELYGIMIKQNYYSSNYGDSGYLFVIVDVNDPKEPIIKVRVWQKEKDPDFSGLPDF